VRLADFAFSGAEVCRVEVATVCVAGDEVACAARGLLDERLAGVTGELTLSLARPVPDQVLPAGAGEVELRPSLPPGRVTGRAVRVDVALLRDGLQLRRVPVSFSVARVGPVAVARTDIPAGRRLGPGSARLVQREVTSVSDLPITDLAELAGMVTARPLRAGQAIPGSALRPAEAPLVVERNRRVFIVVNTPTLRAVTMGKALADARLGEAASAENLASGRRVFGTAVDTDTIEVTLAGSGPHE